MTEIDLLVNLLAECIGNNLSKPWRIKGFWRRTIPPDPWRFLVSSAHGNAQIQVTGPE